MAKGYHHVTQDIRSQIYILKSISLSLRAIANRLGLSTSTISREIKRNTGLRGYRYLQADKLAQERRSQASRTPKKLTPALRAQVEQGLRKEWSPEQLSADLNEKAPTLAMKAFIGSFGQINAKEARFTNTYGMQASVIPNAALVRQEEAVFQGVLIFLSAQLLLKRSRA